MILQANPFRQIQADPILGGVFNTANQSFLNSQQSLASAANNRLNVQLSQENAFLKEQRSALARQDAKELEERRRFETDRSFVRGLFNDRVKNGQFDKTFGENQRQFNNASGGQILSSQTSLANTDKTQLGANQRLGAQLAGSLARQDDAQVFEKEIITQKATEAEKVKKADRDKIGEVGRLRELISNNQATEDDIKKFNDLTGQSSNDVRRNPTGGSNNGDNVDQLEVMENIRKTAADIAKIKKSNPNDPTLPAYEDQLKTLKGLLNSKENGVAPGTPDFKF